MFLIKRLGSQANVLRVAAAAAAVGGSSFAFVSTSANASTAASVTGAASAGSNAAAEKKPCCKSAGSGAASPSSASAGSSSTSSSSSATEGCGCGSAKAVAVPKCRPVILCGPSGAGKSTLIAMLRQEFPDDYGFSVSHTTRAPRPGEVDGKDYHFVSGDESRAAMEKDIKNGLFLESANVHGNLYGTSHAAIESVSKQNRSCILDIDIQGVKSCRKVGFDAAAYVFIAPPSIESLEERLRARGTETEERIRRRLTNAVSEMAESKVMPWDGYIVNDDKHKAYAELRQVLQCQRDECAKARALAAATAEKEKAERMKAKGCPHAAAAAERAAKLAADAAAAGKA